LNERDIHAFFETLCAGDFAAIEKRLHETRK